MTEKISQDITGITFDEFVRFIFAKPVRVSRDSEPWYWHAVITFDSVEITDHYIRLFTEPRFLLQEFLKAELEQGFWAIQSGNLDCGVREIIWMEDLAFSKREQCVRSMFHLWEKLFAIEPLETSAHMWWDSLCFDWHCGNRSRDKGGEDESMQDVMFETLAHILQLESPQCQGDALHGLGHLHHPKTEELITGYIANHPEIEPGTKNYALAAARFEIL